MPLKPLRPCAAPMCPELVRDGPRCPKHAAQRDAQRRADGRAYDKRRGSPASRGYDSRWAAFSRHWRTHVQPLCQECLRAGRTTAAEVVDHIRPWQTGETETERERLKYAPENVQSLCNSDPWQCHRRKTAARDTGLGNPRRSM